MCLESSSALLLMGFFPTLMLQRENCQPSFWHAFAFFNDKWHHWKATENCLLITVKLFKEADKAISKGACYHERHYRSVRSSGLKEHNFIKSCHLYLYRSKEPPDWCVEIVMGTGLVFIRPIKCSVWPFIIYCILNARDVAAHLQGEELESGQLIKWEELAAKAVWHCQLPLLTITSIPIAILTFSFRERRKYTRSSKIRTAIALP